MHYNLGGSTELLISGLTAVATSETSARTVAATLSYVIVTVLLKSKARTNLITEVENVEPLLSNKLNIS